MDRPLQLSAIDHVHLMPHVDVHNDKFLLRLFVPEGSILLQVTFAR